MSSIAWFAAGTSILGAAVVFGSAWGILEGTDRTKHATTQRFRVEFLNIVYMIACFVNGIVFLCIGAGRALDWDMDCRVVDLVSHLTPPCYALPLVLRAATVLLRFDTSLRVQYGWILRLEAHVGLLVCAIILEFCAKAVLDVALGRPAWYLFLPRVGAQCVPYLDWEVFAVLLLAYIAVAGVIVRAMIKRKVSDAFSLAFEVQLTAVSWFVLGLPIMTFVIMYRVSDETVEWEARTFPAWILSLTMYAISIAISGGLTLRDAVQLLSVSIRVFPESPRMATDLESERENESSAQLGGVLNADRSAEDALSLICHPSHLQEAYRGVHEQAAESGWPMDKELSAEEVVSLWLESDTAENLQLNAAAKTIVLDATEQQVRQRWPLSRIVEHQGALTVLRGFARKLLCPELLDFLVAVHEYRSRGRRLRAALNSLARARLAPKQEDETTFLTLSTAKKPVTRAFARNTVLASYLKGDNLQDPTGPGKKDGGEKEDGDADESGTSLDGNEGDNDLETGSMIMGVIERERARSTDHGRRQLSVPVNPSMIAALGKEVDDKDKTRAVSVAVNSAVRPPKSRTSDFPVFAQRHASAPMGKGSGSVQQPASTVVTRRSDEDSKPTSNSLRKIMSQRQGGVVEAIAEESQVQDSGGGEEEDDESYVVKGGAAVDTSPISADDRGSREKDMTDDGRVGDVVDTSPVSAAERDTSEQNEGGRQTDQHTTGDNDDAPDNSSSASAHDQRHQRESEASNSQDWRVLMESRDTSSRDARRAPEADMVPDPVVAPAPSEDGFEVSPNPGNAEAVISLTPLAHTELSPVPSADEGSKKARRASLRGLGGLDEQVDYRPTVTEEKAAEIENDRSERVQSTTDVDRRRRSNPNAVAAVMIRRRTSPVPANNGIDLSDENDQDQSLFRATRWTSVGHGVLAKVNLVSRGHANGSVTTLGSSDSHTRAAAGIHVVLDARPLRRLAEQIYGLFLNRSASLEINLSDERRRRLQNRIWLLLGVDIPEAASRARPLLDALETNDTPTILSYSSKLPDLVRLVRDPDASTARALTHAPPLLGPSGVVVFGKVHFGRSSGLSQSSFFVPDVRPSPSPRPGNSSPRPGNSSSRPSVDTLPHVGSNPSMLRVTYSTTEPDTHHQPIRNSSSNTKPRPPVTHVARVATHSTIDSSAPPPVVQPPAPYYRRPSSKSGTGEAESSHSSLQSPTNYNTKHDPKSPKPSQAPNSSDSFPHPPPRVLSPSPSPNPPQNHRQHSHKDRTSRKPSTTSSPNKLNSSGNKSGSTLNPADAALTGLTPLVNAVRHLTSIYDPAVEDVLKLIERNIYLPFVRSPDASKLLLLDFAGVGVNN